jgi:hypothetical protein
MMNVLSPLYASFLFPWHDESARKILTLQIRKLYQNLTIGVPLSFQNRDNPGQVTCHQGFDFEQKKLQPRALPAKTSNF